MPATIMVENFDPILKFNQKYNDSNTQCRNIRLINLNIGTIFYYSN